MNREGAILILAIWLLPTAQAAPTASGAFLVEGGTFLPAGAELSFQPRLAYLDDASALQGVLLEADRVVVWEFEKTYVETNLAPTPIQVGDGQEPKPDQNVYHDAKLQLVAARSGFVGLYPAATAAASFTGSSNAAVRAQGETEVKTYTGTGESEDPLVGSQYKRVVREPHVRIDGAGIYEHHGAGILKVMGADLSLESREGSRTLRTGWSDPGERVYERTQRWIVVEFEGDLRIEGLSSWVLAGVDAAGAWSGSALFTPAEGFLDAPEGRYFATSGAATLEGAFQGTFAPQEKGSSYRTNLTLEGVLESTTLPREARSLAQQVVVDPAYHRLALIVLAAVMGVGASFGTGLWIARQRRAAAPAQEEPLPFTVDDCMAAAAEAADDEDWPRAAEWLQRVRRIAPTSARTAADLAHAYGQMGQWEESLAMYEEASSLSADGEADFNAAMVALDAGLDPDLVEARLARALARSPNYVVDVESDPAFSRLRGRPRFEKMVRDAWERADDVDASGAAVRP